jgi:hypothetical protein
VLLPAHVGDLVYSVWHFVWWLFMIGLEILIKYMLAKKINYVDHTFYFKQRLYCSLLDYKGVVFLFFYCAKFVCL